MEWPARRLAQRVRPRSHALQQPPPCANYATACAVAAEASARRFAAAGRSTAPPAIHKLALSATIELVTREGDGANSQMPGAARLHHEIGQTSSELHTLAPDPLVVCSLPVNLPPLGHNSPPRPSKF